MRARSCPWWVDREAGKTTLLRQMLGLERPHRGSIRVFGVPLHTCDAGLFKKIRKRLGVLFQHGASTARSAFSTTSRCR